MDSDTAAERLFTRRFLAYFAVWLVTCAMTYVAAITFVQVPEKNQRFADTVLGFILGTVLGAPIGFYYTTSRTSAAKDQTIQDMAKAAVVASPVDPEAPNSVVFTIPPSEESKVVST